MRKMYLIYARDAGRMKIGISHDPVKRLKQMQTGCPVRLELFAFSNSKTAGIKERDLHRRFEHRKVHGEWFELSPKDYIDLLKEWNYDVGIHYSRRTIENIGVSESAYISFDSTSLCTVEVMAFNVTCNEATVKITGKIGIGAGTVGDCHGLFADEVRKNPIDALINRVTL